MMPAVFERSRLGQVITVKGSLVFGDHLELAKALNEKRLRQATMLDMQQARFVGSSGISAFIHAVIHAGTSSRPFTVILDRDQSEWQRLFLAFDSEQRVKVMHKVRRKKK